MLSFDTRASLIEALSLPLDPVLHDLLTARITDAIARGLGDLTHILVIQSGDTEADNIDAIGFSPLVHDTDDPGWDYRLDHGGWTELLYCVGDSGFAYILFVQGEAGITVSIPYCL